jgi:FlaG/FlaF family flagellin (archaellin)
MATPLLVGVTVVLAAVVGAVALEFTPPEPADHRVLAANASTDGTIRLVHEAGSEIDLQGASIVVAVDGEELDHQPPVPFFSATGFHPGPTGAFNVATDNVLEPGDTASLQVAGTNDPVLVSGATVTIRFVEDGMQVAVVETTVEGS